MLSLPWQGSISTGAHALSHSQSASITLNGADSSVSQECMTLQKRVCCDFPGSWERHDCPQPVLPWSSAAPSGSRSLIQSRARAESTSAWTHTDTGAAARRGRSWFIARLWDFTGTAPAFRQSCTDANHALMLPKCTLPASTSAWFN